MIKKDKITIYTQIVINGVAYDSFTQPVNSLHYTVVPNNERLETMTVETELAKKLEREYV